MTTVDYRPGADATTAQCRVETTHETRYSRTHAGERMGLGELGPDDRGGRTERTYLSKDRAQGRTHRASRGRPVVGQDGGKLAGTCARGRAGLGGSTEYAAVAAVSISLPPMGGERRIAVSWLTFH